MAASLERALRGEVVRAGTGNPARPSAVRLARAALADWPDGRAIVGLNGASGVPKPPDVPRRVPIGSVFDAVRLAERAVDGTSASTRSAYGAQAIPCALVPFLHTDL